MDAMPSGDPDGLSEKNRWSSSSTSVQSSAGRISRRPPRTQCTHARPSDATSGPMLLRNRSNFVMPCFGNSQDRRRIPKEPSGAGEDWRPGSTGARIIGGSRREDLVAGLDYGPTRKRAERQVEPRCRIINSRTETHPQPMCSNAVFLPRMPQSIDGRSGKHRVSCTTPTM